MNTLNRSTIVSLLITLACAGGLALPAHALQTQEVEIGSEAGYDDTVAIARDSSGRMTFRDADLVAGVTLRELYELSSGPDFIDIDEITAGRLAVDELEIDDHGLRNPNSGGEIHIQTLGGGLLRLFAPTQVASDLEITGAATLGDAPTDIITITGSIADGLKPNAPTTSFLGTVLQPWGALYLDSVMLDGNALAAAGSGGLALRDDGGNPGVFVEDGGMVGVGTEDPGSNLDVRGAAIIGGNSGLDGLRIVKSGTSTLLQSGNGSGASGAVVIAPWFGGTPWFTVGNTGNVGIGLSTPAHPLEFASGAKVTSAGVFVDASSRDYKTQIADEATTGTQADGRVGLWDLIDQIEVRRFQYREMIDERVVRPSPDGPTTETRRVRGETGDGVVRSGLIYEELPAQLRHGDRGVSATELAVVAIAAAQENKRRVLRLEQALRRSEGRLRTMEARAAAAGNRNATPAVPLFDEADH